MLGSRKAAFFILAKVYKLVHEWQQHLQTKPGLPEWQAYLFLSSSLVSSAISTYG